jgi:biopolymer transport protein ExbB
MELPSVLEAAMHDFGLEHLLVLFMIATSFLLVAIFVERAIAYALLRVALSGAAKVVEAGRKGSLGDARAACDGAKNAVGNILLAGLERAQGTVKGEPARAMMREKKRLSGKLKARTWVLATAGALMPFVGLFGTVIGVMAAFQSIGESGQGGFAVVSVGISQALIATAVGIAVALEGVFLFNLLQAVSGKLTREVALLVDEMLELIEAEGRGGAHAGRS